MIESYHFGSITINGKTYHYDVEAHSNGKILSWSREESHIIDIKDIKRAVEENPKIIIIGTGEAGIAEVTNEAQKFIKEKNIELIIKKTNEATEIFNSCQKSQARLPAQAGLRRQEKVIGLFHLTC